eukprot:10259646-Ditylum_brightwellii.AAC.1
MGFPFWTEACTISSHLSGLSHEGLGVAKHFGSDSRNDVNLDGVHYCLHGDSHISYYLSMKLNPT